MFGITPYRKNMDLFANPFRAMDAFERSFFAPESFGFRTDIEDQGDSLLLSADLPGFDKQDIHIDIERDRLTISAERRSNYEKKDQQGNYLRCERSYGSFHRSFGLDGIDAEKITAAYHNGVLQLTLPKQTPTQPETRRIEIQ